MKNKHLCLFAALTANTLMAAQTVLPVDSAVTINKLENGLTYILRHNEFPKDRADFYIVQKVGAVQEEDNQNGLAHFLEHMAFNGTKNFPDKKLIEYLETVGVRFGANLNAYTSHDNTVYYFTDVPTTRTSIIDSALMILHDWSGQISLSKDEIDKERGVILEEWRQGRNGSRRTTQTHLKNLFKGTPYAVRDVIGDTAVINNFSPDFLRQYYHKWYRPDLQGIVVVGDVDVEYVEKKIAELWQDIPAQQNPAERIYHATEPNAEPLASVATDPEVSYIIADVTFRYQNLPMQWRNTLEALATRVKLSIFLNGISLRLSDLTQKPSCPCSYIYCGISNQTPLTNGIVFRGEAKNDSLSQSIDLLFTEVERVRRYGITHSELDMIKIAMLKSIENRLLAKERRHNSEFTGLYQDVFLDNSSMMDIDTESAVLKQLIETTTVEELNALASMVIGQNVVISVTAPSEAKGVPTEAELVERYKKSQELAIEAPAEKTVDAPLVDHTPTPGTIVKATPDALFGAEEWILSNGVKVYLRPTKFDHNSISIDAQGYGGYSRHNPADKTNFDIMMSVNNRSGLGNHSREDLRRIMIGKSASISKGVSDTYETISGYSSTQDFETALQLLYLNFQPMRRDTDAFETVKADMRTQIINTERLPMKAFSDTISKIVDGANPYYCPMTLEALEKTDLDRIIELYNARFDNAADFTYFIVGDFEMDKVREPILTWLGGLATKPEREEFNNFGIPIPSGKIANSFNRKMDTNKTTVYVLYSGSMKCTYRNQYIMEMLSRLLDMRYLETIREDEGGSYGVSCGANVERVHNQYWLRASFDTDPERIEHLLPIIEREIKIIAENGPKLDDLAKVKENIKKSLAEARETNGHWASAMVTKIMWGDDIDTDKEKMIDGISPDDIKAAAAACISDGNRIEVVMNPEKE